MGWYKTQDQMIHELNGFVFSSDPVNKTNDPMNPIDVHNKNYIMELKNREAYTPERFNGSLIEKIKYDFLVKNCGDRIPGYVCRFKYVSYWDWNLKNSLGISCPCDKATSVKYINSMFLVINICQIKIILLA